MKRLMKASERACAEAAQILREQIEIEFTEVEQALMDAELLTRDEVVEARLSSN